MVQHRAGFDFGHTTMGHPRERSRSYIYGMPPPNTSVISNASSPQSSRSSSRSSHSSDSSSSCSDSGYGSASSSSSSSSASHRRDTHHHWLAHHRDCPRRGPPGFIPYDPPSDGGMPVIPDPSASSAAIPHVGFERPDPFILPQGAPPHIHHRLSTPPPNPHPVPNLNARPPDDRIYAFHAHLQQYCHPNPTDTTGFIHAPSLQWDIIHPPSRARYLPGNGTIHSPNYTEAACAPPTVRRIHFTSRHECLRFWMAPDRWGPIIIDDPHLPTVHRILEKIHDYLRQPLSQTDIATIHSKPINRRRLNEARLFRLHDTAGMHPYQGYVRSDVLGGHRRFFGCIMFIQDGLWRASVDFIPGPVPKLYH
ncbi:uncharacterized protein BT62DRAFT_997067 [Guyanagaster necrorhizus]|uniref:DUF6699 domain-containing protein n=1 Tax=Guyanagaster necrorhizus TaxID=856835 RepID=A0A9P8ANA8_9AGAR|nr:uncharacterized protein BT62DRAFT_997067 [Guyanagaster necrorhizus MCA 3950]KAG7441619.1 hypothetical protein BT62DRAFT_997067 [Guyanagaster necrorhizus MCA 3950]